MSGPSLLFLMRHGRAAPERDGRTVMAGSADYQLTPQGVAEFTAWSGRFAAVKLDRIWSSPLLRAAESAGLILAGQPEPGPEIELVPELKEIALGDWEGLCRDEIMRRWPREWEERGRDFAATAPPGGESVNDLARRVLPAFNRIMAKASGMGRSMLVAHQAVNRVILSTVTGAALDGVMAIPQDSACLNVISLKNGRAELAAANITRPEEFAL